MPELDPANEARHEAAVKQPRDSKGHFIKNAGTGIPEASAPKLPSFVSVNQGGQEQQLVVTTKRTDAPLFDLKITNPVVYLKAWWKRIIANEGVDFRFRIRPLTAIAIAVSVATIGFGLGRVTLPASSPIIKYLPMLAPSPSPNVWKETAFTGVLKYTEANQRYYLVTTEVEAVTLNAPTNVNLAKLIGKRILAVGYYNTQTGIMTVTDTTDMEILPAQVVPVPTTLPTPTSPPTSVPISTP